ncbi:MAG: Jag N-terminal domain-containing protein [Acidimicrobiaceae bacterium]|nr:Jag N-terminal domain-containing protein [Acidimicrobiaceae bacterium]
MEWLEVTAPSMERAKEMVLDLLGVDEDDAEFKVLSEGKVGLFGKVKEEVRIRARVSPMVPRPKRQIDRRRSTNSRSLSRKKTGGRSSRNKAKQAQSVPAEQRQKNTSQSSSGKRMVDISHAKTKARTDTSKGEHKKSTPGKPSLSLADQADLAESFVSDVGDILGATLNFKRHDLKDSILRIEVTGEDIGLLIGQRGATARSIDSLVRTVLRRSGSAAHEGKIRVDIGGLSVRRNEALISFTKDAAQTVLESGKEIRFEPMGRIDRKTVHDVVSEINGVETHSEGSDPTRYVVIKTS